MIAVELGEVLGDFALPIGVVECVVDQRGLDAEARGLVAVDGERQCGAARLLVAGDIAQLRQRLHLGEDLRGPRVELAQIGVEQRVLILRAGQPAADIDVLRHLQEQCRALDLGQLGLQPADDLVGRDVALVARLQRDEEAPVVLRLGAAGADRHADRGDGGIPAHHLAEGALAADHLGEGDVLGRLGGADDEARYPAAERSPWE